MGANDAIVHREEPWHKPWPESGLESVDGCPVCGQFENEILESALVDNTFRVAAGGWSLLRCNSCRSAYLNPRPNRASIHQAYSNYYTHNEMAQKLGHSELSFGRKIRRRIVNGYTNRRYGTKSLPEYKWGFLLVTIIPGAKKTLDHEYRELPKRAGRVLDVGCGNGAFLRIASNCGWDAVGLDPDPEVGDKTSKQEYIVHQGGIEYFEGQSELFDVITLNHVIEHVPDPVRVLKLCNDLLKPGGKIWLETPNIESFGYARFGKCWRGLEAPRHLVLFNVNSLHYCLAAAGFRAMKWGGRKSPCVGVYRESCAIENGGLPSSYPSALSLVDFFAAKRDGLVGYFYKSRREFMTILAVKN